MFRLLLIVTGFSFILCHPNVNEQDPRIINGLAAQLRQFPYACSLRRAGTLNHVGGGSLISDTWVLTAKSVTQMFNAPNELAVATGILNFGVTVVSPGLVSIAQAITNHPNANLAVVRILAIACNAARFGVISSIFLESRLQPNETNALVAGWGPITSDKEPNSVLRFVRTSTILNQNGNYCPDTSTTLCTWNVACTTDIGGPLVTSAGLIGVASTTECGGLDTYLRISSYRDWITAITGV